MLCQMLVEWLFVLPYVMVCALLASLESIATVYHIAQLVCGCFVG